MGGRKLSPRYVLVYGRSSNCTGIPRRQQKRAELERQDERLLSFDRLTPAKRSVLYSCVRKKQDGYKVVSVPPCLTIINSGEIYTDSAGWDLALDRCPDMADRRREYLKEQFSLLMENPGAYVTTHPSGMRTRRLAWL
jgi:hypothetical protein